MTRQVRRAIQRGAAQVAGFTLIANRKVDSAIAAEALHLMAVNKLSAVEADYQARRKVARTLPAPRPFRHLFPRPSKSDQLCYRLGGQACA